MDSTQAEAISQSVRQRARDHQRKKLRKKERAVRGVLLQTTPAEAHWLVALAPPSLIGCELALPSVAQPGRRGGASP